ncbi:MULTISPECIES: hypothetical protein [Micrococcaceae]|uniref:hypothetical protein n=1 Tax=Micrococcaceae TaxID=1268 RepID=UPI0006CF77D2|nr:MULTISPECIES: hypothetical protein [Micrococcaceae]MCD4850728.1 hypothetical protein [Arthrobacter sp. AK01]MCP1415698.1 hypothetical protein [Paenarthrobacter sp. A20]
MGLRNILNRRRKIVGPSAAAPARKSAELEAAWADLRQTVDESKVTSFRACSRTGRSWAEDPEAVRQIAATIGHIMNDTADGPKDNPAR